jgi:NADH-quinone oxidoreductase subunit F
VNGVFAGGDCVTGPWTVIGAIQQGKQAASAIDKYLGGSGEVVEKFTGVRKITGSLLETEEPRRRAPVMPAADRHGFMEVEQTLSVEAAVAEASRCLRCDVKE